MKSSPKTVRTSTSATEDSIPYLGSPQGVGYAVPAGVFDTPAHSSIMSQYVRVYLTNQRQGTASAKDRSQITATTKKMYRQKGTGNARHGSAKAPIFVGGGVVGGPKPKEYALSMNKEQKRLALLTSLAGKLKDQSFSVIPPKALQECKKTKDFAKYLAEKLHDVRVTLVCDVREDAQVCRVARNIPTVCIVSCDSLNPYRVLDNTHLLCTENALKKILQYFTSTHDN